MLTFLEQEDIYHLIVNRTAMAMSRAINANFKRHDIPITKEQFSVLVVLWKQDGCSQQHLAEKTYRDKPGITRLIDHLERDGFVVRKHDPHDRRSNLIFLTPKGRSLEKTVVASVHQTLERATQNIPEQDLKHLKQTLNAVYKNLEENIPLV